MATIQKIKLINGIGVFHGFTWPCDLDSFKDLNLIYGLNGSGKTTLSNILRCLETKKCTSGEFTAHIDGSDISSDRLDTYTDLPQVRVFNRNFIDENVFTSFGTCCPIFVIGKDSAAKQQLVANKNSELTILGKEFKYTEDFKDDLEGQLKNIQTTTAGTIKAILRSSDIGNPYNNYDKRTFASKCEEYKALRSKPVSLSDEQKEKHNLVLKGSPKKIISELEFTTPDLNQLKSSVDAVLSQRVVSNVIETLKSNPGVNSWVEHGLKLHQQLNVGVCQFCAGPLPDDRIKSLEEHFSDEYAALSMAISRIREGVAAYKIKLNQLTLPDEARVYDEFALLYRIAVDDINRARQSIQDFLDNIDEALRKKQANPFGIIACNVTVPMPVDLEGVNMQIRAHNSRTENFQADIAASRVLLEEAFVSEKYDKVLDLEQQIVESIAKSKDLLGRIKIIRAEVKRLEADIIEHRRPADEINSDLASYLGRKDITLDVEDAGYRIMRNGQPASNLSEGEQTALAVIYFLKSIEDRGFTKAKGIVVIDDPVSSLDANAMYYAFSFIQSRTKDVGQLFIMTHNFGFLRLVRKWFFRNNMYKNRPKDAQMYMLKCQESNHGRQAVLSELDPLLSEYESEYSYLFSQVVNGSSESAGSIETFYHYPNIARRVLEAFLAFRLPYSARTWEDNRFKSDMHKSIHDLGYDSTKSNRILNFLNTHSHNARPDDSVDHDESILLETPAVLTDVLALIQHADKFHYEEMMKLVNSHSNPTTSSPPTP